MIEFVIIALLKIFVVINVMMGIVAYTVMLERWVCAWMQDRVGPNRVGPFGLLQPMADGVKLILKEDVLPHHVHKVLYTLGPMLVPRPLLPRAIAWNSLAWQSASIIGPTIGGFLCAISPAVSFGAAFGFYAASAICLLLIRAETRPVAQAGSR